MIGPTYIIVTRNPKTQQLLVIRGPNSDQIAEFESFEDAQIVAKTSQICKAWGFEILKVWGLDKRNPEDTHG
jgi:hypothetical protein